MDLRKIAEDGYGSIHQSSHMTVGTDRPFSHANSSSIGSGTVSACGTTRSRCAEMKLHDSALVPSRWFCALLLALPTVLWAEVGWTATPRRPNIVLVFADDLGWNQLGCYGNAFYETRNLDRLAAGGMRFTDAYAAAPVCSPTRASLMTGKYPARLHLTDYIPGNPYPHARLVTPAWTAYLPRSEVTIAELLQRGGYVSGHFGKWHLNKDKQYAPGRPRDPASQGFDDVLTTRKPNSKETAHAGADPDADPHHVKAITDRAIAFIERHRDGPFFCYLAHNSIHNPVMEYAPRIVKYATKAAACNRTGNNPVHGAMVETLDRSVGRLMQTLEQLGIAENTLLIFYSDNGALFGRAGREPFYGAKADLYEGGIRVPLIVRWPAAVEPGSVCHELVSSVDFLPTFAALAGIELADPQVDGVSLVPALTGRGPIGRTTLYWHYPHYHSAGIAPSGAIRDGKYKLIEWFEKSVDGQAGTGPLELYDLAADPGERHSLVAAMPDKTAQMHAKLKAWRAAVGAQMMRPNPDYDPGRAGKGAKKR
jgi:arylsulfatase A